MANGDYSKATSYKIQVDTLVEQEKTSGLFFPYQIRIIHCKLCGMSQTIRPKIY